MKKEYIKPFAKVKVIEMIVMQAVSETMGMSSGSADPSTASAKEFEDLLDFFFGE